ncbi:U-box domain-containing protein [Legionella sp.]|uniref:U-box domain-containing protein n=1 Tax=Legionella sp. TaxID=459 RepID=UPI003220039D
MKEKIVVKAGETSSINELSQQQMTQLRISKKIAANPPKNSADIFIFKHMTSQQSEAVFRSRIVEWVKRHGQPQDRQTFFLIRDSSDGGSVALERFQYDQKNNRWRGYQEPGVLIHRDGTEEPWIIMPIRFCLCKNGWVQNPHPVDSKAFHEVNEQQGGKLFSVTAEIANKHYNSLLMTIWSCIGFSSKLMEQIFPYEGEQTKKLVYEGDTNNKNNTRPQAVSVLGKDNDKYLRKNHPSSIPLPPEITALLSCTLQEDITAYPGFFDNSLAECVLMDDPVVCIHDGESYERRHLERLGFREKADFYPNFHLRKIREYLYCRDKDTGWIIEKINATLGDTVTHELLKPPVIIAPSGQSYSDCKNGIKDWLKRNQTDPITGEATAIGDLVPNKRLGRFLEEWEKCSSQLTLNESRTLGKDL